MTSEHLSWSLQKLPKVGTRTLFLVHRDTLNPPISKGSLVFKIRGMLGRNRQLVKLWVSIALVVCTDAKRNKTLVVQVGEPGCIVIIFLPGRTDITLRRKMS